MHLRSPLVVAALALLPLGMAPAQDRLLGAIQYSMAYPIGDAERYAPGMSFSGLTWEWRDNLRPHTSIGLLTGFNEFHARRGGTFAFPAGAVTGEQYRHLLMIPVLATGAWYFNTNRNDPRWYVGGGIGPQFTQQLFQLGLLEDRRREWELAVVPEAGLAFKMWYGTGGIVSLRYHWQTASNDFLGGFDRFQYVSLSFGIGFRDPEPSVQASTAPVAVRPVEP